MRRSSQKALAVSAGFELGWLAFGSGTRKRRLAPIPDNWQAVDDVELERLCGLARVVKTKPDIDQGAQPAVAISPASAGGAAAPDRAGSQLDTSNSPARTRVPRIRQRREHTARSSGSALAILATATSDAPVEVTVREYARQARELDLPAIEAMVQLKGLLARVYTDAGSDARDLRAVRRWFVEAFYFERAVPDPDVSDQSR